MARVLLGLGSNLGNRWTFLNAAVSQLRDLDLRLLVSSVYETQPVGGPGNQRAYLNCVVSLHTELSPVELLRACQDLEQAAHRVRVEHWGPRTLDIDVLYVEGFSSSDPELVVPHPRMFERAFVLAPLEEVAPEIAGSAWRVRLGTQEGEIKKVGALLSGVNVVDLS